MSPTYEDQVRLYLDAEVSAPAADLDVLVQRLMTHGIDLEHSECLIAFVPIAFARVLLSPAGVTFQSSYLIKDPRTGASARGELRDEPIFEVATLIAKELAHGEAVSRQHLRNVAAQSAEYDVALQLAGPEGDLSGIVLTEPLLMRVPIEHLSNRRHRGLWRFWRK